MAHLLIARAASPIIGLTAETLAHRKAKSQIDLTDSEQLGKTRSDPTLATAAWESPSHLSLPPDAPISSAPPPYDEVTNATSPNTERAVSVDSKEKVEEKAIPEEEGEENSDINEENWQLHEAGDATGESASTASISCVPKGSVFGPLSIKTLVQALVDAYPPVKSDAVLENPVCLPQKRPKTQNRGFVHAYAPALSDFAISEQTWIDFLLSFEESIKISPAFDVFNAAIGIAGLVGHFVPDPFTTAVTVALTVANETAKATFGRVRTNSFLAEINDRFFMPRGLYCLIMTYNSRSRAVSQPFDLSSTLIKRGTPSGNQVRAYMKRNMGGVGNYGTTHGPAELPQASPLIFPAVERARQGASKDENSDEQQKKEGRFARTRNFVDDYFDRRAQSKFATRNPGNSLASDPSFESNLGSLGTRTFRTGRGGPIGAPLSRIVEYASHGKYKGRDANPIIMAARALQPKVVYLMVTRLPTKEEMHTVLDNMFVKELSSEKEAEAYEKETEEIAI